MTVWITQCLCPDRHCIMAAADEAEHEAAARDKIETELRAFVTLAVESGAIDRECGLCGAPRSSWVYETRRTMFASIGDAMPSLRAVEREQQLTRMMWSNLHKTDRPN